MCNARTVSFHYRPPYQLIEFSCSAVACITMSHAMWLTPDTRHMHYTCMEVSYMIQVDKYSTRPYTVHANRVSHPALQQIPRILVRRTHTKTGQELCNTTSVIVHTCVCSIATRKLAGGQHVGLMMMSQLEVGTSIPPCAKSAFQET
jgi:hypothetical protein